jgi:lipid A 3-O-deacylase
MIVCKVKGCLDFSVTAVAAMRHARRFCHSGVAELDLRPVDLLDVGSCARGVAMRRLVVALGVLVALGLSQASGQELGVSEVRGGIFAHSVDEPGNFLGIYNTSRIQDVNVELLFEVPAMTDWLAWGELRPHLGATVNFGGLESMIYGGVSWTVPVGESPLFLEASFGGAVHNGSTGPYGTVSFPARDLGCSLVFRESVSVGVMINDNASLMATVEHASNANLCVSNRGLTNLGVRFGWRF